MDWSDEDRLRLIGFKNAVDSDDVKVKEGIKKLLLDNKYIIKVLHNTELEDADADPDDYFDVNILPYYIVSPTQHNIKNYLCYEVTYNTVDKYNRLEKELNVIFYVLCEHTDIKEQFTGLARHDLLAALVQDQFNFTNYFGKKLYLVSDVAGVVDSDYASRVLTFKQVTDNNVVKTKNGVPMLANKEVIAFEES